MQSTVLNRQSLLDIAVQDCGSAEAAVSISMQSDVAITDDMPAGQSLEYTPDKVNRKIVSRLASYRVKPATAITEDDAELLTWGGIGYMGIQIDFKVY